MEWMDQKNGVGSLKAAAKLIVVGVCTLAFALNAAAVVVTLLTDRYAGSRDFVTYWAAGQQLVHHADPYDGRTVLPIERQAGFPNDTPPMVMRNAPPALLAVLPLGFFPVRLASVYWGVILAGALGLSIRIVAGLFERERSLATLIACSFAPALSCLIAGQMSIFALLGLVLFLKMQHRSPFWAGCSLWLCALKPQIFVLFGIVLVLWVVKNRSYRVLAGLLVTLGASAACAMALDPHVWADYFRMLQKEKIPDLMIPCIGTVLRLITWPDRAWVQLIPLALGSAWAVWYFFRNQDSWEWLEHGSSVMLASVLAAPYSWFMDQSVLLPALMKEVSDGASGASIAVLALLSAIVEFANLRGVPLSTMALYSSSAAWWVLWYMWVLRKRGQISKQPSTTYASADTV